MKHEQIGRHFRALFISDVHLGARGSQADKLIDFLRYHDADTIYLVGDIIDGWQLQSSWRWPQSHNDVVQKLLRKTRKGARIIYVPGNHDEFLRNYYGSHFGGVEVVAQTIHISATGKSFLVTHGDLFDIVIKHARWVAHLGDKAYDFAIFANTLFNKFRLLFGLPYWSLSKWAKFKVKNAVNFIGEFEQVLIKEARRSGVDGVICGHIHHAALREENSFTYMNCGDWVESCTALVEHEDGRFEILTWTDITAESEEVEFVPGTAGRLMRVLVATDAWHPQVNGVVRTLSATAEAGRQLGANFFFFTPADFPKFPLPNYPEIQVALPSMRKIKRRIAEIRPNAIHIATEGPIGLAVRRYCRGRRIPFTTSFHTRFPEYVSARYPIPESWIWAYLRWFHGASGRVMAATDAIVSELQARKFEHVVHWSRGVDTQLFKPRAEADLGLQRPVFLAVGRVAVEKNLEAFLALDLPGTKVIVGDGPARVALSQKYPDAVFLGMQQGEDLAHIYAAADTFVFPSRTDTFGLVLLEALASGLPVAAFPVEGVRAVMGSAPVSVLDEDLRVACLRALELSADNCREFASSWSWENSTRRFLGHAVRLPASIMSDLSFEFEPKTFFG